MNFTAKLPNGMTKDVWIASLKPDDHFCTRRPMKCANCGENSMRHIPTIYGEMTCEKLIPCLWQPLPPVLKVGKKYAICSGRGTPALCECGLKKKSHVCGHYYKPLSCELVSVMDEEEWLAREMAIWIKNVSPSIPAKDHEKEWRNAVGYERKQEAHREGFETWEQLDKWIVDYYGWRPKMWRYCFRR